MENKNQNQNNNQKRFKVTTSERISVNSLINRLLIELPELYQPMKNTNDDIIGIWMEYRSSWLINARQLHYYSKYFGDDSSEMFYLKSMNTK